MSTLLIFLLFLCDAIIIKMERKSLEKTSILIYPIKHTNNTLTSPALEKENSDWLKSAIFETFSEKNLLKDITRTLQVKKEDKRCSLPLSIQKLPTMREIKSLSPKLRKDWLENFISTVKTWDNKNKQIEELEKDQFKMRSSIAYILKSVESFRKIPPKNHKHQEY